DHLGLALDDLPRPLERLAPLLEIAIGLELADPGQPPLHALLRALGRAHGFLLRCHIVSEEIDEVAHGSYSSIGSLEPAAPRHRRSQEIDVRRQRGRTILSGGPMKAYLLTTGSLFALMTIVHVWRMIVETGFSREPSVLVVTIVAALLCAWAARLLMASRNAP